MPVLHHHTVNVTLSVAIGVDEHMSRGAAESVTLTFVSGTREAGNTAQDGALAKTIDAVIGELQAKIQASVEAGVSRGEDE